MDEGFPFLLVIGVFILAISSRILAGVMDRSRIDKYFQAKNCTLLSIGWEPFGPGWWGSNNERIYKVFYLDDERGRHQAHIKTSLMAGVYLTEDHLISPGPKPKDDGEAKLDPDTLVVENERLRRRIQELEQREC